MRHLAVLTLGVILSGSIAVAGMMAICPPMPCCLGANASMDTPEPNCCVATQAPGEQPRNTASKSAFLFRPDPAEAVSCDAAGSLVALPLSASLSPSPPTVHQRLAFLSLLLI